ncbi:TetR/AcrR family transcriptional regulator [Saccharomonospora iraqiensis]|uniref:TetR/AcrR family transcriptional regulator n=1 Tax=Saccharomonospora iraqiensis TaxID=52698 RepID=UPI00022E1269|nr:TetR/AcrR family transcriptional regulator [Saccharomonospora iraqiensis]
MSDRHTYHHGDLRRAVLDAAVEVITADGPAAVSLRDLARRAGVSHAAPAHHFGDKAGLLTAIAVEGNEMLAASLSEALADGTRALLEFGVRYVEFAESHPAHFEVMYRPDLHHRDDPALMRARRNTAELLRTGVAALPRTAAGDTGLGAVASWSLAHGFATLWRTGNLEGWVRDDPPGEVFRRVAEFAPRPLG